MTQMDFNNSTGESERNAWEVLKRAAFLWKGARQDHLSHTIVLINFFFLFSRLPTTISILAELQITIVLAVICFFLMLPKYARILNNQTKILLGFLVYNAIMVVLGKLVFDDLILNDGQAFSRWRTLTQDFLCFLMPVAIFSMYGAGWRKVESVLVFCGAYLGLYAITHAGVGPGGFVADENDNCLVLVMLFPFAAMGFLHHRGIFRKLAYAASCFLIMGGVVATMSRGGFLGFLSTALFLFWTSQKKPLLLAVAFSGALILLPLVPSSYWQEMKTIQREENSGTGLERLESWKVGVQMWLDPANFIQGVGIANGPWTLTKYQPDERSRLIKNISGRQFHSMHIELIGDFGLLGIIFLYGLMLSSFKKNNSIARDAKALYIKNNNIYLTYSKLYKSVGPDDRVLAKQIEDRLSTCNYLGKNIESWSTFATELNVSLIAILTAGTFISVLYYPPIWFILFMSAAVDKSWKEVRNTFHEHEALAIQLDNSQISNTDESRRAFIERSLGEAD